jgi:ubiquinone/menaquinone biosynthesis C-methylase UbiE
MDTEQQVAKHYGRPGLESVILNAFKASGKDTNRLTTGDLSGADQLHLGWRAATVELAKDLGLARNMHVLDVGSGLGGPARYFAETCDCRVTGIDLTPEFVDVANALTRRCGLDDKAVFRQASALTLPFDAGQFDAATLIHVGMNIEDKAKLFGEVRRVLKRGSRFGVYEVMKVEPENILYPMPWAVTSETSFVEPPDTYRRLLAAAGFAIDSETNRRDFALKLWREMQDNVAKHGPPPLNAQLLVGSASKERLANVVAALQKGTIAPVEMIARAV